MNTFAQKSLVSTCKSYAFRLKHNEDLKQNYKKLLTKITFRQLVF